MNKLYTRLNAALLAGSWTNAVRGALLIITTLVLLNVAPVWSPAWIFALVVLALDLLVVIWELTCAVRKN